jgi:spore germination cell wall hydrolase CwlJ-like protein
MATFGNISSASPNVLFDPMAVDRALQQRQQNALLMDMQREDQQFQRENQQFARANGGMTPYQAATLQQQKEALQAERDGVAGLWGNTAPVAPVAAPAAPAAPADGTPVAAAPGDLAARVLYGEAGNQGPQGMLAAAHVIANRARLTGKSPEEVVTAPGQFEAYGNEATRAKLLALKPEQYAAAQQALQAATSGQAPDPTGGATHYLNPQLQAQMGRQQPAWATGEGRQIGAHVFYSRPGDFRQTAQTPAAARTGGTDVAGPGMPAAPGGLALDPPGTPEWARGTTAEDQARLRAMSGPGVTKGHIVAEAARMAAANRAQLRFEQQHPQQTGPAAPYSGTGIEAQDSNILLRGDPGSREYAGAYARQAAVIRRPDGSEIRPDMSPYEPPTFRSGAAPAGGAEAPARGRDYGVPEEVKPPQPSADQLKVSTFADRMAKASPIIDQNYEAGQSLGQRALEYVPGGSYVASEAKQKLDQAKRDFINAVLRRESGASISPAEFENAEQQYFPQPGQSATVVEQKRAARETVLNGFRREAGPTYKPPEGPAPKLPEGWSIKEVK